MAVDDSYTVALLHFDGVSGSSDFTDQSGKSWTGAASAQLSNAAARFGQTSLIVSSSDYEIYTADHADFGFGSDDFTVECWVYLSGDSASNRTIMCQAASFNSSDVAFALRRNGTSKAIDFICGNGTTSVTASGATLTDYTGWHHIAGVKYGTELAVYVDGVKGGTTGSISTAIIDTVQNVYIGNFYNTTSAAWSGYIDEVRISKGIARYSASFTPRTVPFGFMSGEYSYFADGLSIY